MALIVWGNGHDLWLGGVEIAGTWLRTLKLGAKLEEQETTPMGGALAKTFVPGLESVTFEHGGMYESVGATSDGPDNAIFPKLGTVDVPVSFSPGTGAEGDVVFFFRSDTFSYSVGGQVGEVMPYTASGMASNGQLVRGNVLRSGTLNATGTVNGTGQSLGAVAATQVAYAALHVGTCTGTSPQVTVKIQSAATADATFTTPTDRITFTAAGTNSYQWGSVAGAITDTRWRVVTTVTGTSPVIPIFVSFGIR